jgi:hypothetical protein
MGKFAVLGITALVGEGDGYALILGTPGFPGSPYIFGYGLFGCGFNQAHFKKVRAVVFNDLNYWRMRLSRISISTALKG